jgi:CheY-like chemotaxis protein/two-component sensor histidine kinase
MQAIASYTSALEAALNNQDISSAHQTIKGLACSVDLLADSFNKILDITNIENGDYEPNISNVSVNQLLLKIQQHYAPLAAIKGIKLKVVIREKQPLAIDTDEHLLDQIIGNLVDNAVKYTQNGWVLVRTTKIKRILRIHVIDTGIGMPMEYREKIFEPFYRINEQSEEQGCGIGLSYINKTIQKLPKHQFEFYSKLQIGTHFFVDAPISELPYLHPHFQENDTRQVPNKFILLIDDNKAVLNALGEQLKSQGYMLETALSLPEANRILENHLSIPDLIITDLKLRDGETAEDVIRCVHGFCKQTPVIVISGEPTRNKTIQILGNEYIVLKKPINNSLLLTTISEVLE